MIICRWILLPILVKDVTLNRVVMVVVKCTLWFSDIFREYKNGPVAWNRLHFIRQNKLKSHYATVILLDVLFYAKFKVYYKLKLKSHDIYELKIW